MSDERPKPRPIVVRNVTNDLGKSGTDLIYCFFLPTDIDGFYNFVSEDGRTLATGVSSDNPFPFMLDGHAWTITNFKIDDLVATGNWTNSAPTPIGSVADNAQSGSFQASSSGDVDPEVAVPSPPGAIRMTSVTGTSDRTKLATLYFLEAGTTNTYNLFNRNDNLLATGLTNGNNFGFQHDALTATTQINWSVTGFSISPTAASGTWSNNDTAGGRQGGSFQALSSGDPLGKAASAS